jgi:hypothetical protein
MFLVIVFIFSSYIDSHPFSFISWFLLNILYQCVFSLIYYNTFKI